MCSAEASCFETCLDKQCLQSPSSLLFSRHYDGCCCWFPESHIHMLLLLASSPVHSIDMRHAVETITSAHPQISLGILVVRFMIESMAWQGLHLARLRRTCQTNQGLHYPQRLSDSTEQSGSSRWHLTHCSFQHVNMVAFSCTLKRRSPVPTRVLNDHEDWNLLPGHRRIEADPLLWFQCIAPAGTASLSHVIAVNLYAICTCVMR